MGRKSTYTKVIVAYIQELNEVRAFHLSAIAEAGFVKAVSAARAQKEWKTSLYGLSDIENEVWVFQHSHEFEPVTLSDRDAKQVPATIPANEKSQKLFFQPVIKAGVIRSTNEKYQEIFQHVAGLRQDFSEYIASEQDYLRGILEKKMGPNNSPPSYQNGQDAERVNNEVNAPEIENHDQGRTIPVSEMGGNGINFDRRISARKEDGFDFAGLNEPASQPSTDDDLPF
jgi:hypothetical protein